MITVSLETALKLKEKGWNKKTVFFGQCDTEEVCIGPNSRDIEKRPMEGSIVKISSIEEYSHEKYSQLVVYCPTAQEIIDDILPIIVIKRVFYGLALFPGTKKVTVNYENYEKVLHYEEGETLADALANLRVRCKENGYLPSKHTEETKT